MAGQRKMIIITSNEEIIRQFSFNKTKDTHIIHLNNDKQVTSTEPNGNNIINLAFLAELSRPNFNRDQVYKRALESSDLNPLKAVKASKKSINMICGNCGNQAIGFNYGVLSCASCKAFFRRKANQNIEKMRCLTGQDQCSVAHEVRRKCPKCRLKRCFAVGMRKELFLSEEEKQQRRKHVKESRNLRSQSSSTTAAQSVSDSESLSPTLDEIDRLLMDIEQVSDDIVLQQDNKSNKMEDKSFGTLSIEDWLTIQSVQSSFVSVFNVPTEPFSVYIDLSNRTSALISWSEYINQLALRFINFFREIDEFQRLLIDDRLILIKHNLLLALPICKCNKFKNPGDQGSFKQEMEEHGRFYSLLNASNTIRHTFVGMVFSVLQNTDGNPTLLSLLLIIIILTPGLSMNEEVPRLNDPLAVNRVQCYYTKILWNYLVSQFGEKEACRRFTQLLTLILQLQSRNEILWLFFRNECVKANTVDKLAPLMQSVLNIT